MRALTSQETHPRSGLSGAERETFAREGWLRPAHRLPLSTLARLRAVADRTTALLGDRIPETVVCTHIPGWNGLPDEITSEWLALAAEPELIDMVTDLIGPDVLLWGSQYLCKPASKGIEVPWHQDGRYWPIHPLITCTIWIAIDDATRSNGCMRYIPGSHRAGIMYPHVEDRRDGIVLNQVVEPGHFDESTAKFAELDAGEVALHDVYLIHGSEPNRSGNRRAAYILRFMSGEAYFDREENKENASAHYSPQFARRPLYLVRGQPGRNHAMVERHPLYRA